MTLRRPVLTTLLLALATTALLGGARLASNADSPPPAPAAAVPAAEAVGKLTLAEHLGHHRLRHHRALFSMVVYAPGTNTRSEQWTFTDVLLAGLQYSRLDPRQGPARHPAVDLPSGDLGRTPPTVSTEVQTYSYDTATRTNC